MISKTEDIQNLNHESLRYKGVIVIGYDKHNGMEFQREVHNQADFEDAILKAKAIESVVQVKAEFPG
jgi:hypothetical protein